MTVCMILGYKEELWDCTLSSIIEIQTPRIVCLLELCNSVDNGSRMKLYLQDLSYGGHIVNVLIDVDVEASLNSSIHLLRTKYSCTHQAYTSVCMNCVTKRPQS